jgi:hypothetical protein
MRYSTQALVAVGALAASLTFAPPAAAQPRGGAVQGRAVPRAPAVRGVRPPAVGVFPYRPYVFAPGFSLGFYYGYPYFGGYPYFAGYPYFYRHPPYGYPLYGYGVPVRPYGGVRLLVAQKNAEVSVDGYDVGTVGDFDGVFKYLTLAPGPHRIEVQAQGFEPLTFDVATEAGRTITYRAEMRPAQP